MIKLFQPLAAAVSNELDSYTLTVLFANNLTVSEKISDVGNLRSLCNVKILMCQDDYIIN